MEQVERRVDEQRRCPRGMRHFILAPCSFDQGGVEDRQL